MAYEELRGIGPQDPDAAGETAGRARGRVNVQSLLEKALAANPAELRAAQSLPYDESRTRTLDLEEVRDVALDLRGKESFLEKDDLVEGASVRGQGDRFAVILACRRAPRSGNPEDGRSFKAMLPYADLSRSQSAFDRLRENAEGAGAARGPIGDEDALRAAEDRSRELEAELKTAREASETASEPWEGYGDANAPEIVNSIKEGGREEYGRRGLEDIIAYEEAGENRVTVVKAAQDALSDEGE